jgi:pimeloyl-ACP methyl ester carboxylesterase
VRIHRENVTGHDERRKAFSRKPSRASCNEHSRPMTTPLFAAESGVGSKTIVLLHGFGGGHHVWDEVVPRLAPFARTLAYDLPGHGLSLDFPAAGPAKVAARAVLADVATRGLERIHLVGHSMGGAVATLMALSDPARIASVTLLAPGGFGPEINGPLLRDYAAAATRSGIRTCLAAMAGQPAPSFDGTVEALWEMRRRPGQQAKIVEIAAAMTGDGRQGVIPRDRLGALTMPVMVVWGADDPVLPVSQAEGLPAHFHLHHVLGAGHMLPEEAPDLVADIVRRNINRSPNALRLQVACGS